MVYKDILKNAGNWTSIVVMEKILNHLCLVFHNQFFCFGFLIFRNSGLIDIHIYV